MRYAPANTTLPSPPDRYEQSYMARAINSLNTLQTGAVTKNEAVPSVLLQSPDGSVYKVEVDNAGNLVTTAVPFGQQGSPSY